MEKVSIIVPVYNGEKTLEACVGSLLAQTYKNLEIIIINDGSTDNSSKIINNYYKENPKVIKVIEQQNSGVSAARNKGLSQVTGDYILFVDSDDYLHRDCIQEVLRNAKQRDADIARFRMTYKYIDGTEKVETSDFPSETFVEKKDFKKHIYVKMMNGIKLNSIIRTLYKNDVIKDITLREDMVTAEDLMFNIEAFTKANRYLYLLQPYYYYYQSNQGLTGTSISVLAKYKYNFIISIALLKHLKQWEMFSPLYIFKAVFRLLYITVSKLRRRFFQGV